MTVDLTASGRWLVDYHDLDATEPNTVAYTVPAAGAGAAAHRVLASAAPAGTATMTVRLPGREARFSEPPLRRMADLVADTGPRLAEHVRAHGLPFVLVGECVGALSAYELARFLAGQGLPPAALLVIGQWGPADRPAEEALHELPGEQFRQALLDHGFVAPEIGDDPDVFAMFEATMRADWALAHAYRWQPGGFADFPVSVVARTLDGTTAEALRASWAPTTSGRTSVVTSVAEGYADERDAVSVELTRLAALAGARQPIVQGG
jgi:surfactin synthase thioesterase subunit